MIKLAPKYFIILLIRFYRFFISPFFFPCCRFYPSCSSFALKAIDKYGIMLGGLVAIKRLFRCNPFCKHIGYDPLP